jgi:hypothetical protein
LGDARPIDEYVLPDTALGLISTRGRSIVANPANLGSVRSFVPGERGLQRFVRSGPYKAVKPAQGFQGAAVFRGAEGYADVFVQVNVGATIRSRDIAALAVNPDAYGRHAVFRLSTETGQQRFVRLNPEKFPKRQAGAALKQIDAGTLDDVAAKRFVREGVKRGWLRIGNTLDEVAYAAYDRTAAGGRAMRPRRLPAATPTAYQRPSETTKGWFIPKIAQVEDVVAQKASGLVGTIVPSSVYAQRPPDNAMANATWDGSAGLYREIVAQPRGTVVDVVSDASWIQLPLSREYFAVPRFDAVYLSPQTTVVPAYYPKAMGPLERDLILARILEGELRRSFRGVREYLIHDIRGMTTFVRYDGRQSISRDTLVNLIEHLIKGIPSTTRLDIEKAGIAIQTGDLGRFYPEAQVDWSIGGLIPGVPIEKQVEKRLAVVRRELQDQITQAQEGTTRFPKRVFTAVLFDTIKRDASAVHPSVVLRRSPIKEYDINRRTFADRAIDTAFEHASDALLLALQGLPIPAFTRSSDKVNSYVTPSGFGVSADSGIVRLRAQDDLTVGWGQAGRWTSGQRRESRARVRRVLQHHIDRVGMNATAARAMRNRLVGDGHPVDLFGNGSAFAPPGAWADDYDAKGYGNDFNTLKLHRGRSLGAEEWQRILRENYRADVDNAMPMASEWMASAHQRIAWGDPDELPLLWETAPEQVAGYIAMMRGAFVPFGGTRT